MTQIKLFAEKTPRFEEVEKMVNDFLNANEGKILVRDIKHCGRYWWKQFMEKLDCDGDL